VDETLAFKSGDDVVDGIASIQGYSIIFFVTLIFPFSNFALLRTASAWTHAPVLAEFWLTEDVRH